MPQATARRPAAPRRTRPPTNLPEPVSELIGRDAELDEILDLSASHRLVTLTGAGASARRASASRSRGACCRDLPMGSGPSSWHRCPIPTSSRSPSPRRSGSTCRGHGSPRSRRERAPVEAAYARARQLRACGRRGGAHGRGVVACQPGDACHCDQPRAAASRGRADFPGTAARRAAGAARDSEDPLRYGAVRLFVERARAAAPHFSPDAHDVRRSRNLPAARRHPAGDRARGGARGDARHRGARARLDDRFDCLPAADGRRCRGIRPCGRRSTGATSC